MTLYLMEIVKEKQKQFLLFQNKSQIVNGSSLYLYKNLQLVWVDTGEVQQEVPACVLQLHVHALLLRSLQGTEHHSSQHQVKKNPRQDGEQGGAAHGCTSTQSKRWLLLLSASLSAGVAAAEISATTQVDWLHTDYGAWQQPRLPTRLQQPDY